MTNLVPIPDFGETKDFHPEQAPDIQKVLSDAAAADPTTPFYDAEQDIWVQPTPAPVGTPATELPENTVEYPGDFTPADRAKLEYIYTTMQQVGNLIAQITPEQIGQIQKLQSNPLLRKLMGNILPGTGD